jgi:hypothetical protein
MSLDALLILDVRRLDDWRALQQANGRELEPLLRRLPDRESSAQNQNHIHSCLWQAALLVLRADEQRVGRFFVLDYVFHVVVLVDVESLCIVHAIEGTRL